MHCNYPIMFIKKRSKQANHRVMLRVSVSIIGSMIVSESESFCWNATRVMCECSILSGPDAAIAAVSRLAVRVPPRNSRTRNRRKKIPPSSREQWTWSMKKFTLSPALCYGQFNEFVRKKVKFEIPFWISALWDTPLIFFLLCVFFYCRTKNSIWQNARRKIW